MDRNRKRKEDFEKLRGQLEELHLESMYIGEELNKMKNRWDELNNESDFLSDECKSVDFALMNLPFLIIKGGKSSEEFFDEGKETSLQNRREFFSLRKKGIKLKEKYCACLLEASVLYSTRCFFEKKLVKITKTQVMLIKHYFKEEDLEEGLLE